MAMVPFYSRFRELATRETRYATVRGHPALPDGDYGFIELYCDDLHCDCRRVVLNVFSSAAPTKVLATINYGWEDITFYEEWLGDKELAQDAVGAAIDPLNPQTTYAPALLELFRYIVEDEAYVERLRRHYAMFKADLRGPGKRVRGKKRKPRR